MQQSDAVQEVGVEPLRERRLLSDLLLTAQGAHRTEVVAKAALILSAVTSFAVLVSPLYKH